MSIPFALDGLASPLPFLANGVTQVAWVVQDLDAAVQTHWRLFGVGPWHYYLYDGNLLSMMRRNGRDAEYSMSTAVANAGATRFEIIQPLEGDTIYHEFVKQRGYGGLHHFGLAVDDMKASIQLARQAGFHVTMEGSGYGLDGDGHFAYLDTEEAFGIILELMERPKRRRLPWKIFPAPES
jgi:methylmalonyl-CoA/ethylmalonyl-CoA epimerase